MLLIKVTDAFKELVQMAKDDKSGKLARLAGKISEHGWERALDNVITGEFPDGVDEDELRDTFMNRSDGILRSLGGPDVLDEEKCAADILACIS